MATCSPYGLFLMKSVELAGDGQPCWKIAQ